MKNKDYKQTLEEIATKIRTTRQTQKISIQELAYRCEMERSNMSRIETGKVNITIKTLTLIANALNVNIKDLL